MPGLPAALVRHRERLDEIAEVLAKYGFAAWVQRGSGLVSARVMKGLVDHYVDPEIVAMSDGERLRRALTELGTTWIKFGQMLSLRPDVVGDDVAVELTKLQATVAADPPGVAQALVERELGAAVSDLYGTFDPEPMASGSVAQVHRATLHDGTAVVVKVLHDGVEHRVLEDLELMDAIATYLEHQDPGFAQLRPTVIVGEFSQMLHDAIDLSQELRNLQRFTLNFADEPDIVIPTPYPELSRRRVLTMSLISGAPFTDRASVEATGWDVDVARASRRRRLPRDDLPRFALSRRPPTREPPASRRDAHRDPRFRRRRPHLFDAQTPARGPGDCRGNPRPRRLHRRRRRDHDATADRRHEPVAIADRHVAEPLPAHRGRTPRHGRDHHHGHAAPARQRPRVAGRPVAALSGPVGAPGTRSRSEHRSPGHRVARALHEEVAGRAVRPAASRPPCEPNVSRVGPSGWLPCPATSRRSSSRSAPASSASTSGSTIPTARWIISSTASSPPLPCSRPRSWSRVAPARRSGRSRCRAWSPPASVCSPGNGSSDADASTRRGSAAPTNWRSCADDVPSPDRHRGCEPTSSRLF